MTEQDAFEAWHRELPVKEFGSVTPAQAWHAALEWSRTQQEPVGEMQESQLIPVFVVPVIEQPLPIGTKLYAAPVAPPVKKGWKWVPEEPTPEMLNEIRIAYPGQQAYRAMLAAAPEYKEDK